VDCTYSSQRAQLNAQVPERRAKPVLSRTHVVLLPTFPIPRVGESHYREKTKLPKLAETSVFKISIGAYPASFLSGNSGLQKDSDRFSVGIRSFVKVGFKFAQRPHCRRHGRPGNKSGSTDPQDGDR
jgi:hypothetical protein